jgi:recombination protein RecA
MAKKKQDTHISKSISETLEDLKKAYGTEVFLSKQEHNKIERIVVGFPSIDDVLGGGSPIGRIMLFQGKESGAKSTISLLISAAYQKQNLFVAWIDVEYSFDYEWAEKMGVDTSPDKFQLIQPETAEEVFDIAYKLSETGGIGLIVVDSISALKTNSEHSGEFGDANMGSLARAMGQGFRKTTESFFKNNTTVIFISQLREAIGIMFGSNERISGGNSTKFFSSIMCDTRKIKSIKKGDDVIGVEIRFKNIKNKTARPYKQRDLTFYLDSGFDILSDYINYGVECGFIQKGGAWYTVGEERFQGVEKVKDYFNTNPDMLEKLKRNVINFISRNSISDTSTPENIEEDKQ